MVQNGMFWTTQEELYIVYYTIIYYRKINVHRVKQSIWEDPIGTTVTLGRFSYPYVLQHYCMK